MINNHSLFSAPPSFPQMPAKERTSLNDYAMADRPPQDEQATNLHLDKVTGEKISKTELKRRQRQRERDAKKQERAGAVTAGSSTETPATFEPDEEELTSNVSCLCPVRSCIACLRLTTHQ